MVRTLLQRAEAIQIACQADDLELAQGAARQYWEFLWAQDMSFTRSDLADGSYTSARALAQEKRRDAMRIAKEEWVEGII